MEKGLYKNQKTFLVKSVGRGSRPSQETNGVLAIQPWTMLSQLHHKETGGHKSSELLKGGRNELTRGMLLMGDATRF